MAEWECGVRREYSTRARVPARKCMFCRTPDKQIFSCFVYEFTIYNVRYACSMYCMILYPVPIPLG